MEEKQAPGTTLIHSQPSQVGQQHWLKIQSARWLNFESAPTDTVTIGHFLPSAIVRSRVERDMP